MNKYVRDQYTSLPHHHHSLNSTLTPFGQRRNSLLIAELSQNHTKYNMEKVRLTNQSLEQCRKVLTKVRSISKHITRNSEALWAKAIVRTVKAHSIS